MSAQNSTGIQMLLDAERQAQTIVQKARTYRTQKVKDARSEAQKEIEEYKKQKDAEFRQFEAEHSGVNAQAEQQASREVEAKLQEIQEVGKQKMVQVVVDLVNAVVDIQPSLHRNAVKI